MSRSYSTLILVVRFGAHTSIKTLSCQLNIMFGDELRNHLDNKRVRSDLIKTMKNTNGYCDYHALADPDVGGPTRSWGGPGSRAH